MDWEEQPQVPEEPQETSSEEPQQAVCEDKSVDYDNRGTTYLLKGEYDRAITEFNKAIEINPSLAMAYDNRATAYYMKGEHKKAWDDFHKAQSLGYQVRSGFLKALREASAGEGHESRIGYRSSERGKRLAER
jgi:tetratricopeptide (TPR) repeat protein